MCTTHVLVALGRPEENIGFLGTGVTAVLSHGVGHGDTA